MDIYKLKSLSAEERNTILIGESDHSEEMTYMVPMDDTELAIVKDTLAANSLKKAYLDEEIDEAKAAFKERMEPLKNAISEAINELKTKQRTVTGKVYMIPDFDHKMMHTVDEAGNVLNSRPLKNEERQYRLPSANREAV